MQFFLVTFILFLLDGISKQIVHVSMKPSQSIPLIKNVLHLTYVQNHGAAFGLFLGKTLFLILAGIFAIFVILKIYDKTKIKIPLAMILAGTLGNVFDRIFRSYVIDFIDFRFWPVFNFADIIINIGVFIIILQFFFNKRVEV